MSKPRESALLIFHEKLALNSGLIDERKIWRIARLDRYPSGYKYRLVQVNPKTHEVVLLYGNHWPKGPHVHWGKEERPYEFKTLEQLILDFIREAALEEKRYESKKDHH